MGQRGPIPKGRVKIEWSPEFAYAIGLIVTDGSLSKDERHICLTSKDEELIENFQRALKIRYRVGRKGSGTQKDKRYFLIQIGDVLFYQFLLTIGLMPNKTKIIGEVKIPREYFFDFLRGHLDGDGCFYSYWDPRWKSSFMFYTTFISASRSHIDWLRSEIFEALTVKGHITGDGKKSVYQLKYAKAESLKIIKNVYYNKQVLCLSRKRIKIEKALQNQRT